MDCCPHCDEYIDLKEYLQDSNEGDFECPRCTCILRAVVTDEGPWISKVTPEDQRLRASGASELPGLELPKAAGL